MMKPAPSGSKKSAVARREMSMGGVFTVCALLGAALFTVWTISSPQQQEAAISTFRRLVTATGLVTEHVPEAGEIDK